VNRLTLSKSVTLKKGETAALLDEHGAGVLTGLRLTMKPWTRDTFYKVRLRVRWDDHAAPMQAEWYRIYADDDDDRSTAGGSPRARN
jgi:hypothetical protein